MPKDANLSTTIENCVWQYDEMVKRTASQTREATSNWESLYRPVGLLHAIGISKKWHFWAEFKQKSKRNMKLCHKRDNSATITRAHCQNAAVVWTLSDLFRHSKVVEIKIGLGILDGALLVNIDCPTILSQYRNILLALWQKHIINPLVVWQHISNHILDQWRNRREIREAF